MFINIITPCCRPYNLKKIEESINIPKDKYRWIIVFDSNELPDDSLIPNNCEVYCNKNNMSISGNSQRNFALDLIKDGYIYFNDDDTLLHPELWEAVKDLDNDFISFDQVNKNGVLRLQSEEIKVGNIDSHNFIISSDILESNRWILNRYDADGYFAEECFRKSKSFLYINRVLSIYNILNNEK